MSYVLEPVQYSVNVLSKEGRCFSIATEMGGNVLAVVDDAQWVQVPGSLKHVSVGVDGSVWGVNASNQVFRRVSAEWKQVSGALTQISVYSDSRVAGVTPDSKILAWGGGGWDIVSSSFNAGPPGGARYIAVGAVGRPWSINVNDDIFEWNGSSWTQVAGKLRQISFGNSRTLGGVKADNTVWVRDGSAWKQIAGALKHVSVASADGEVWGVTPTDTLVRWDGRSGWEARPGSLKQIAVGSATNIWGVDASDRIFRRGHRVIGEPWTGDPRQQWRFRPNDDGTHRIENVATGQVLDIRGASKESGADAFIWPWQAGSSQRWKVTNLGSYYFRLQAAVSGLALGVASGAIVQTPSSGDPGQLWRLTEIRPAPVSSVPTMKYLVAPVPHNSSSSPPRAQSREYALISATSGLALRPSDTPGAAASIARWDESALQRWRIVANGDGTFRVENVGNGQVLDVRGLSLTPGAEVQTVAWNGGNNQRWKLEASGNNLLRLRAVHSGLLLHASFAGTPVGQALDDGAAGEVIVYKDSEYRGTSQKFGVGRWDYEQLNKIGNDSVSSLKVPQGLRVTLFQHSRFLGDSQTYSADTSYTSGFNDRTSSLIIQAESKWSSMTKVILYSGADYTGTSQEMGVGAYNSGKLTVGVRTISSLKVPPGKRVILCSADGFAGVSRTYTADTPSLAGFNDVAVSVLVDDITSGLNQHWQLVLLRQRGSITQPNPVVLFADAQNEGPGSSGATQQLGLGSWPRSSLTIGDNVVSEVEVPRGMRVKLYDSDNFGGTSIDLKSDRRWPLAGQFDERTSSVDVQPVVYFFGEFDSEENYPLDSSGWELAPGRYNRAKLYDGVVPDKLAYIEVPHGMRVTLYDQDNFTGNELILVESTLLAVTDPFRDKVRSVLVQHVGVPIAPLAVKYGDRLQFVTDSGRLASVALADGTRVNTFVVACSGPAKLTSLVSYGDVVSLQVGSGAVTLYTGAEFTGTSQRLGVGRWMTADLTIGADTLASIKIPTGMKVTLFRDNNFKGKLATLTRDQSGLWFTDTIRQTSSLIVEQGASGTITIFGDANFSGASQQLGVGRWRKADLSIGDNTLSSIKVPEGMKVTLYQDDDFAGSSLSYTSDVAFVQAFNDMTSSLMVEQTPTFYLNVAADGSIAAKTPITSAPGVQEKFRVMLSGASSQGSIVTHGDTVSFDALSQSRLLTANATGQLVATATAIGSNERMVLRDVRALNNFGEGGDGSGPCGADVCGEQLCGTAVAAGVCGVDACGAEACVVDVCGAAFCGADGSLIRACSTAGAIFNFCGADVCTSAFWIANACSAAACGADAGGLSACGVAACSADASGITACGVAACEAAAVGIGACGVDACQWAACGADACGAAVGGAAVCAAAVCGAAVCETALSGVDVCGANACAADCCGINLCPLDACGADACGLDIVPLIPFI